MDILTRWILSFALLVRDSQHLNESQLHDREKFTYTEKPGTRNKEE